MSLFNESYDVITKSYCGILSILFALSIALPLITHTFKLGANLLVSFSQFKVSELGHTTNDGIFPSLFT